MVRRLLCLGVFLLALCVSACGDTKPTQRPTFPDPEGSPEPKLGGAKSG